MSIDSFPAARLAKEVDMLRAALKQRDERIAVLEAAARDVLAKASNLTVGDGLSCNGQSDEHVAEDCEGDGPDDPVHQFGDALDVLSRALAPTGEGEVAPAAPMEDVPRVLKAGDRTCLTCANAVDGTALRRDSQNLPCVFCGAATEYSQPYPPGVVTRPHRLIKRGGK